MKLTFEKELAIKRSVIQATEKGVGVSKLAEHFGVSKSTIYKYRRILTEQGFLIKESDGIYLVAENKYSNKPSTQPKIHTLDLSLSDDGIKEEDKVEIVVNNNTPFEFDNEGSITDHHQYHSQETDLSDNIEHQESPIIIKERENYRKDYTSKEMPNKKRKNIVKNLFSKVTKRK
mgnify:CR=1 FL=1